LIVHLVRLLPMDRQPEYPALFPERVLDEMRCRVIDQYFRHYNENLTIDELAERLSLSPKQTGRVLKQHYNVVQGKAAPYAHRSGQRIAANERIADRAHFEAGRL